MEEVKEEKEIQEANIEDVKIEDTSIVENPKKEKKKITPWSVIKMILLIITSPIWFPWKILFVRRKGNKFKDVNLFKKIFRIVRFPITKTIKFAIFAFIMVLELSLVYKLRYSPITYTITRNAVHKYYLREESNSKELLGFVDNVYAGDIAVHYDEFKSAFDHIDTWTLGDKNKMYVILNSDVAKMFFEYAPDEFTTFLLEEFNDNETFRTNIKYIVSNVNKTLSRLIRDLTALLPSDEAQIIMQPIAGATSVSMDYTVVLNAVGGILRTYESEFNIETDEDYELRETDKEGIVESIDMLALYSKGKSLEEIYKEFEKTGIFENESSNQVGELTSIH